MDQPAHMQIRWWLVPNILALDAPLVAVVWQRFLCEHFESPVPWQATFALFAAVWCIYLFDRMMDARRGAIDGARHRAAARDPRGFLIGAITAGLLALAASLTLPNEYMQYGAVLSLAIAAYLVLVHAIESRFFGVGGIKEWLVAAGFAGGVAAPLAVHVHPAMEWLPSVAAFGGVCWVNCRLIEHWESTQPHTLHTTMLVSACVLAGCLALPCAIASAIVSSILGLWIVHLVCGTKPDLARVLADVVLLTPLLIMVPL